MLEKLNIRSAKSSDLLGILNLFTDTVSSICKNDYSEEQIRVWMASVDNTERWLSKVSSQYFLVVELNGKIVGFASLEWNDYLDLLYVHKDFQKQGIADVLYSEIENEVKRRGAKRIVSDVSITARPFFEKKGFDVVSFQTQKIQDVEIGNYKMVKEF